MKMKFKTARYVCVLILLGNLLITAIPAFAQTDTITAEIPLWNKNVPDGPGPSGTEIMTKRGSITNISAPRLVVYRAKHPNGTAMLVISGGGYAHIESGNESKPAAQWLQSENVTAFELIYRLPGEGWSTKNVPFEDAQRAMRIIRSRANAFHLDPHRIGIMGFSAGGHLAAMTATEPDQERYTAVDDADRLSARPDFAVLLYPVITFLPPFEHTHSEKEICGLEPTLKRQAEFSAQLHVTDRTPPAFLAQAEDDPISNIENSKLMYGALQAHGISSELHVFHSGGHGWGMGAPGSPEQNWPQLFKNWAMKKGYWRIK